MKPTSHKEVLDILEWANSEREPLTIIGHETKVNLGQVTDTKSIINLRAISGIEIYDPNELVITVKAGTPVAEVIDILDQNNQYLSFEPPDFGLLLDATKNAGTIGGLISCNLSGPRRIKSGAARDHFLGFRGISGRGEEFKSGGKVVKNVTGFDLSKLIAGSFGTLGVMTEVTLRALPKPEKIRTILIQWPTDTVFDASSINSMMDAICSVNEISGAAFLPSKASCTSKVDLVSRPNCNITAIRIEGSLLSVTHRSNVLKKLLKKYGAIEELHSKNSAILWQEIRDVSLIEKKSTDLIWKISCPPSRSPEIMFNISKNCKGEAIYDWGGGLIWFKMNANSTNCGHIIRSTLDSTGGHATLFTAPKEVRQKIDVFHPQPDQLKALTRRIKNGFDPLQILNPNRMYQGI